MTPPRADAPSPPDAAARTVLDSLHPLLEPTAPSWLPQTPGWAVLGVLLTALGCWLAWRAGKHWHQRRHRRVAARQLHQLRAVLKSAQSSPGQRVAAARELPTLVRRLALAHAQRERVAPLVGDAWLAWLDSSLPTGGGAFTRGAGRSLNDWAYLPAAALPWPELEGLLDLLERWIPQHQAPKGTP